MELAPINAQYQPDQPAYCGNCAWQGKLSQVSPIITSVQNRLHIGETIPAGECRRCEGLCYVQDDLAEAAEDLLAVCRAAKDMLRELAGDDLAQNDPARLILDRLDAVIAKAAGATG